MLARMDEKGGSQFLDGFPGYCIDIILIIRFDLEIIVGTVIKAYRSISFNKLAAGLKKVSDILIVVFLQDIHCA